jgi:hypothetical protein
MSNPHARNSGEPPPTPNRNFSHPNRQRASSLSSEHNQNSLSLMVNDSRYMLPILPSGFLPRSPSAQSLQTEQDRHAGFDFGHESQVRPETSLTTFSSGSVPDLNATALPPMPDREAPPVPQLPPQYTALASAPPAVTINPPSPSRSIRRSHSSPTKSAKSGKGSRWGRWSMRVKTVFRFKRYTKTPVQAALPPAMDESEPSAPAIVISGPIGFQHVSSNTVKDLRAPGTGLFASPHWMPPVRSGEEQRRVMMSGGLGISGLDQPSSSSHDAESGTPEAGPIKGSTFAGLGRQDADGTAVSDDGDSEWEDSEETRSFLEYHKHRQNGRYSFKP